MGEIAVRDEAKTGPELILCPGCGKEKREDRKFCSKSCSKTGSNNPNWKGRESSADSAYERTRRIYPMLGICAMCSSPAIDRHHVNGDYHNNSPENVMMLCRRDHMKLDGRLETLRERIVEQNRDHPRWW